MGLKLWIQWEWTFLDKPYTNYIFPFYIPEFPGRPRPILNPAITINTTLDYRNPALSCGLFVCFCFFLHDSSMISTENYNPSTAGVFFFFLMSIDIRCLPSSSGWQRKHIHRVLSSKGILHKYQTEECRFNFRNLHNLVITFFLLAVVKQ